MYWLAILFVAQGVFGEDDAILKARSQISETERKQREEKGQLFLLNQKIKEIAKRKAALNDRLLSQEASARELAREVGELEARTVRQKEMLNQRLRQLYQGRSRNPWAWLFSAQSPIELERNHRFLRRMVDSDHEYVKIYLAHLAELKKKRRQLTVAAAKLLNMRKSMQAREEELTEQMRAKSKILAELRESKEGHLSRLRHLRSQTASDESSVDLAFFERRGSLPPPVNGKLRREYGTYVDPQFRFRLMHKGNFYSVPQLTPVRAVFSGKVELATRIPGFGNTVIIDHGENYYSVYAYNSRLRVKEGAPVKEGDVIALSGHSSPLFGPGVYFEIRHFTDAIDPRPWIKESVIKTARRGEP